MLFVPPSMPYMAPEAEASSHTGDGVLCHVDISWTPNPPTAGQTVTFTGKLVEEVNGTCSNSNPPIVGKSVTVQFPIRPTYTLSPASPITNSDGVWTGTIIFDQYDAGLDWKGDIIFDGDKEYCADKNWNLLDKPLSSMLSSF